MLLIDFHFEFFFIHFHWYWVWNTFSLLLFWAEVFIFCKFCGNLARIHSMEADKIVQIDFSQHNIQIFAQQIDIFLRFSQFFILKICKKSLFFLHFTYIHFFCAVFYSFTLIFTLTQCNFMEFERKTRITN
jgi:hypothetical protein